MQISRDKKSLLEFARQVQMWEKNKASRIKTAEEQTFIARFPMLLRC